MEGAASTALGGGWQSTLMSPEVIVARRAASGFLAENAIPSKYSCLINGLPKFTVNEELTIGLLPSPP